MVFVLLAVLAAGDDSFYKAGVPPTPLNAPPVPSSAPSTFSCSVETLRTSQTCVFDGRPAESSDPKAQAAANMAFVVQVTTSLCKSRLDESTLEPAEKDVRTKACMDRVKKVSAQCSAGGKTGIVDAEGRFAPGAKGCYVSLAEAIQRLDLPRMASEKKKSAETP